LYLLLFVSPRVTCLFFSKFPATGAGISNYSKMIGRGKRVERLSPPAKTRCIQSHDKYQLCFEGEP
jgi:hypothetical protein